MSDTAATESDPSGQVARLEQDRQSVDRELDEIEMLLAQAQGEAERHEARRRAAEERFDEMIGPYAIQSGLRDAHQQLMVQTQRAALMAGQIEVLEGKQKVLRRYADGLRQQLAALAELGSDGGGGIEVSSRASSRDVLAAQEDLRRAIARRMHDGPAQSIANIALQAQVAQRLLARDVEAADRELDELRRLVQHALEATKTFIFEVRPMVLDDLGLLPTLRRAARERAQRSGVPVPLDSRGAERRVDAEVESHLFRIVDDAVASFVSRAPEQVTIRLDWAAERLTVLVATHPPSAPAVEEPGPPSRPPKRGKPEEVPEALAGMIAQQTAETAERAAGRYRAYGLSDGQWRDLRSRAAAVGIRLTRDESALRLEAVIDVPTA